MAQFIKILITLLIMVSILPSCSVLKFWDLENTPPQKTQKTQQDCLAFEPHHQALFDESDTYHRVLFQYARSQGYSTPCSQRVIALHELIHIDSAAYDGYTNAKGHLIPYIGDPVWPALNNKDVLSKLTKEEQNKIGNLTWQYMKRAPYNTIANILDELNAYGQTSGYMIPGTPEKTTYLEYQEKYLHLLDAYLRLISEKEKNAYFVMTQNLNAWLTINDIVNQAGKVWPSEKRAAIGKNLSHINSFLTTNPYWSKR
ncbi:MAG: hypothetical protein GY729_17500 [Desulfobacteraceae bacterium]|nr:hypothetical protein [Desulfobacteraceae bacterium]